MIKLSTGGGGVWSGSSISICVTLPLLLKSESLSFLLEPTAAEEAPLAPTRSLAELFSILEALLLWSRTVFFIKVGAADFLVLRSCPALVLSVAGGASETCASCCGGSEKQKTGLSRNFMPLFFRQVCSRQSRTRAKTR